MRPVDCFWEFFESKSDHYSEKYYKIVFVGINSETFVTQESRQTLRHVLKLHPRLIRSYSIGLRIARSFYCSFILSLPHTIRYIRLNIADVSLLFVGKSINHRMSGWYEPSILLLNFDIPLTRNPNPRHSSI